MTLYQESVNLYYLKALPKNTHLLIVLIKHPTYYYGNNYEDLHVSTAINVIFFHGYTER